MEKEDKINFNEEIITDLYINNIKNINNNLKTKIIFNDNQNIKNIKKNITKASIITQFITTIKYNFIQYYTDISIILYNLMQVLFLTILQYGNYYNLGDYNKNTFTAIQNRVGLNFNINVNCIFMGLLTAVKLLIPLKPRLYKERENGLISPVMYSILFNIIEIPKMGFIILIYISLNIYLFKLYDEAEGTLIQVFLNYFKITFLQFYVSNSIGYFFATFFNDIKGVAGLINVVTLPANMLTGFIGNIKTMPIYIQWLSKISNNKYGFQYLINLIFSKRKNIKDCYITINDVQKCKIFSLKAPCTIKLDYDSYPQCNPFNNFNFMESVNDNIYYLLAMILFLRIFGSFIFVKYFKIKAKY